MFFKTNDELFMFILYLLKYIFIILAIHNIVLMDT